MHLHKHFCATFVIFCSFCCLTSLNQHVLKNKYALFSKSNYQTNLFWFSCTLNHYLNCRCFSVEALKSQENKTVEKSVSMNTTVNGSSSSQELIQSDKSRRRKNWTNSCSLILAVSLIGNLLIALLVYKTPTLLGLFQTSYYCRAKLARL